MFCQLFLVTAGMCIAKDHIEFLVSDEWSVKWSPFWHSWQFHPPISCVAIHFNFILEASKFWASYEYILISFLFITTWYLDYFVCIFKGCSRMAISIIEHIFSISNLTKAKFSVDLQTLFWLVINKFAPA